ncbi:MAG: restriction endonuclease subunit S [Acidobacteriota bacterium]|nr:restriction endonuclease subunit S [Acidobacteriota bacterium]
MIASQFYVCANGITRYGLSHGAIKGVLVTVPPPDEQDAIVRFLDWATARLDRAIRIKRKLISLLNEQKQAIIHRAVTFGLDPNVPLKRSGIDWLPEMPAHWETRRNSRLFTERIERGRFGLPILMVSLRTGITEGSAFDADGRPKRLLADSTGYKFAAHGDVAYNMMRMWQGAVGTVPKDGLISPAYVVARPRPGAFSRYYELLFRTDDCKNEVNRMSRGIVSDRNRLYWDQFKRLVVPFPSFEEQKRIVLQVDAETSSLNSAISRISSEVDILLEYRTCLIADVVTGKFDVRGIEIPTEEITEPAEPLESAEFELDEDELVEEYADAD